LDLITEYYRENAIISHVFETVRFTCDTLKEYNIIRTDTKQLIYGIQDRDNVLTNFKASTNDEKKEINDIIYND
jgi:hypothetical protein